MIPRNTSFRTFAGALLFVICASCSLDSRLLSSISASDLIFGVAPSKIVGLKMDGSMHEDTGIPIGVAVTPGAPFGVKGTPARSCLSISPTAGCAEFLWHYSWDGNSPVNMEVLAIDLPADRFPSVIAFRWLWGPLGNGAPPRFSIFISDATRSVPLLNFALTTTMEGVGSAYRPNYNVYKINQYSGADHLITAFEYVCSFYPLAALDPDTWSFLTLAFDAVGRCEIFVNGVLGGSGQCTTLPDRASGTPFRVSFVNQSSGVSLCDLRVFDQPLTHAQTAGLNDGSWNP